MSPPNSRIVELVGGPKDGGRVTVRGNPQFVVWETFVTEPKDYRYGMEIDPDEAVGIRRCRYRIQGAKALFEGW